MEKSEIIMLAHDLILDISLIESGEGVVCLQGPPGKAGYWSWSFRRSRCLVHVGNFRNCTRTELVSAMIEDHPW